MPRQPHTVKRTELKYHVYQDLKEKLIHCTYPPGSMLNEVQLASQYGLSRTPIREAINRLEMDGYVKVIPKKGIYVTDVSLNDVLQIFQTRLEIEPITLRLAIPYLNRDELMFFQKRFESEDLNLEDAFRLDTAMHLFFVEHCGNAYLIEMMRKLFDDNTKAVIATGQNSAKIHDARLEHLEILNSLIRRDDAETSANFLRSHIDTCRKAALNYFYSLNSSHIEPETAYYKEQLSKLPPLPSSQT
ncbi:MAG TPA: GntR family transcriptional regulator [Candidatus Enterocloster faecavium]|uniref:GntR family transcriptional regulator n=1 Tax=Candidatus Enterocloster faecavium TaxID=2838560 RepID=A0A9D2L5K0_9FIRM|nr:GntR family transcriptional regulator [Candidatus Enterocloster faecavium]